MLTTTAFWVGAVVAGGGMLVGDVVASSISTSVGVGAGARKVLGVAGGGAGGVAGVGAGGGAMIARVLLGVAGCGVVLTGGVFQTIGASPGARRENLLCGRRVGGGGAVPLGAAVAGVGGDPPGDRRENLLLALRGIGFGGSVIMTGEGGSK